MEKEDLAQVTEIDREAFPTQWPPANYKQELQNKLAHYLVVCDDSKTVKVPAARSSTGLFQRFSRFMSRLNRSYLPANPSSSTTQQQFIVGFCGIWLLAEEAHITNIAVRQSHQGKGIGELLLIATIDLSRTLSATVMTLEVRVSNKVAQNLYSKYGFAEAGIRKGYYLDNREDAVIMTTESITSTLFQSHLQKLRESLGEKLAFGQ